MYPSTTHGKVWMKRAPHRAIVGAGPWRLGFPVIVEVDAAAVVFAHPSNCHNQVAGAEVVIHHVQNDMMPLVETLDEVFQAVGAAIALPRRRVGAEPHERRRRTQQRA